MRKRILILQISIFVLMISCQKPHLLPKADLAHSPVFTENIDYQRRNYLPVSIDTPLFVSKTTSINGTATQTLCLVNNQLFFATQNGRIYSMFAENIDNNAHKKIGDAINASLTFMQNKLFIPIIKGKDGLVKYDLFGRRIISSSKQDFSSSSPVVFRNKVIHAINSGSVYCLDSKDDKIVWKSELGGKVNSSLSFDGEHLFALTQNGILRCFNIENGNIIWSQKFDDHFYITPLLSKSDVFIAGYKGNLLRLDKKTGEIKNKLELGKSVLTPLSCDEQNLVISTSDGVLRVFNADLENLKWQITLDAPLTIPTLITANVIIAGTSQKSLYILEKNKGGILQKLELKGRPASLPVVYKGKIVLALEYEKIIELQVKK